MSDEWIKLYPYDCQFRIFCHFSYLLYEFLFQIRQLRSQIPYIIYFRNAARFPPEMCVMKAYCFMMVKCDMAFSVVEITLFSIFLEKPFFDPILAGLLKGSKKSDRQGNSQQRGCPKTSRWYNLQENESRWIATASNWESINSSPAYRCVFEFVTLNCVWYIPSRNTHACTLC